MEYLNNKESKISLNLFRARSLNNKTFKSSVQPKTPEVDNKKQRMT
jgi:hypothetical protein